MTQYRLTQLDDGAQWFTDGHDFGVNPDAVPDLLAVAERVLYDLNGMNATKRAVDSKYAASPLCERITQIVKDAADAVHKAKE